MLADGCKIFSHAVSHMNSIMALFRAHELLGTCQFPLNQSTLKSGGWEGDVRVSVCLVGRMKVP